MGLGPESYLFYNNDHHDGFHHGDQTIAMVNFLARWNGQCFLYSVVGDHWSTDGMIRIHRYGLMHASSPAGRDWDSGQGSR